MTEKLSTEKDQKTLADASSKFFENIQESTATCKTPEEALRLSGGIRFTHGYKISLEELQTIYQAGYELYKYPFALGAKANTLRFVKETDKSTEILITPSGTYFVKRPLKECEYTECSCLAEAIAVTQLPTSLENYSASDLDRNIGIYVNEEILPTELVAKLPLSRKDLLELLTDIQNSSPTFEDTFGGA